MYVHTSLLGSPSTADRQIVDPSDINLPLAGIAFILVAIFLRVRTPEGTLRQKLARVDWV